MSRASPSAAAHLPDSVQQAIRDFNAALARSHLHLSSLVLEHAHPIPSSSSSSSNSDPLLLVLNSHDADRAKSHLRIYSSDSSTLPRTPSPSLTSSLPTPLRLPSTLLHHSSIPRNRNRNIPSIPSIPIPIPNSNSLPLPNPSSLLAPLPLPPPTALKRSSFNDSDLPSIPFKRSRSNPDTSSVARQRPLSMPALRSPAPFWGTVLTPPVAQVSTTNTNTNPRDDPRFLPLLQDTLSKKLASNTNIPNINTINTIPNPKLQPSPHVSHIRSHPVADATPTYRPHSSAPEPPYPSSYAPRSRVGGSAGSSAGGVGVGRPRTSLPRLELGSVRGGSSGGSGVRGIMSISSSNTNTNTSSASAPLLPRIEYVSAGNQSNTSSAASGVPPNASTNTGAAGAFSCPHCEAAFKRRSDMNRHVRVVHEKKRPFQCPTCLQRFGEKGNMQKHIRMVHQNIRGFHCQHCGAAFGQRGNCESHIRSVHEKRPGKYECSLCNNRAFARKAHLLDHFAADHPGIPPPSARARPRAPIPPSYPPNASGLGVGVGPPNATGLGVGVGPPTTPFLQQHPTQQQNTNMNNTNKTNITNIIPNLPLFGSRNQRQQMQTLNMAHGIIPVSLPSGNSNININNPDINNTPGWRGAGGSSAGDAAVRRKRDEADGGGR